MRLETSAVYCSAQSISESCRYHCAKRDVRVDVRSLIQRFPLTFFSSTFDWLVNTDRSDRRGW